MRFTRRSQSPCHARATSFPCMMGSGINCQGFGALLHAIDRYFPSPDEACECVGVDVSNGERFTAKYNDRRIPVGEGVQDRGGSVHWKIFPDEDLYRYLKAGQHYL